MAVEQRGAARRALLAVCAVCVCVFSALALTRAARTAAMTSADPAAAGLRGRLARLARSVNRVGDLRSGQVRAAGLSGSDVVKPARVGVTRRSGPRTVTATVSPEATLSQANLAPEVTSERTRKLTSDVTSDLPLEVTQVSPEVTKMVTSEMTPDVTRATSEATPKVTSTDVVADPLRHVFIAVKTSGQFHQDRLPPILDTWFTTAPNQTWFFSDVDDPELQKRTGGHVINTNCSSSHRRDALCCKMAVEYDTFMASGKKWFCHFDDDNYVSAVRLGELLAGYSPRQDWYLGKNSIRAPLQIMDRDRPGERVSFWFATGGAGFCLSRALALKMSPVAGGGRFMRVGDKIRLPDDVTVGYIVEHVLKVPLSVVDQFHSHLEQMKFIPADQLSQQISFSYSQYPDEPNVVSLGTLDEKKDPTRFYSLHCLFHPDAKFCPR